MLSFMNPEGLMTNPVWQDKVYFKCSTDAAAYGYNSLSKDWPIFVIRRIFDGEYYIICHCNKNGVIK